MLRRYGWCGMLSTYQLIDILPISGVGAKANPQRSIPKDQSPEGELAEGQVPDQSACRSSPCFCPFRGRSSAVGENIGVVPPRKIQFRPGVEKIKTGLGHVFAAGPVQHDVEPVHQPVQIKHVRGGVFLLCVA